MSIDLKTIKHISKLSRISVDERKAEKIFSESPNGKTTRGNLTGMVDINIEPARRVSFKLVRD